MVKEGGEEELGLHLEEEEASGVVLESRTHCVNQEKHLELESKKGGNLDEVLLVGKLEVVWSSQLWASVMYRCTRHSAYLNARQGLGNSEPWILQMHSKITDLITKIVTYIQNEQKFSLPLVFS